MRNIARRDFLRSGALGIAGVAATAALPMLGRRLALAGPGSDFFTIAVIPDTQYYVDGTKPQPFNKNIFLDQTKYLADHVSDLNLAFVTHVGDVVEHGDGNTMHFPADYGRPQNVEWLNAMQAMDILEATGLPFGVCIGNHDYDNIYHYGPDSYPPLVSTASWWKKYFGSGSKYFRNKPWYGGASDEVGYISTGAGGSGTGEYPPAGTPCNYGLSSYQFFSGGGKKFLHISLEMEAGNAAIAWAQAVLDSHPDHATVITTHSYISPPRWTDNNLPLDPADPAERNHALWLVGSPNGWNDAQNVWTDLIAPNNQIFLVLCGHSFTATESVEAPSGEVAGVSKGENIRIDNNNDGNPVYQILTDYQGNTTLGSGGGDGWYRFIQFDMDGNNIHFYTLNAYKTINTGRQVLAGKTVIYSDGASDFDQPEGFSDFSLPMPFQVLKSANVIK